MSKVSNAIEVLKQTPATQISTLDFVREKFIQNYNATHKDKSGDMQYHRQMVYFNQQVAASSSLASCDQFSLYACFVTAAVNGYSFDPADDEVYLIPRGGKAYLQRQAGAHVKRLQRIEVVRSVRQAQLVYQGDTFVVKNGIVELHEEHFQSETIVAGYVIFDLDDRGTQKHFIYRRSDWETWRAKSQNPKSYMRQGSKGEYLNESPWDNSTIGGINPNPGFLRTKLILHACKDKSWPTGFTPPTIEAFADVEIDADDEKNEAPKDQNSPNGTIPPNKSKDISSNPSPQEKVPKADEVREGRGEEEKKPSTDHIQDAIIEEPVTNENDF